MPPVFAKPTPKVKSQTAEAKPAEVKREPDSKREPAAEVKAPETPPQADQPGSSSAGPSDDVTYQQTEAAYDFGALLDRLTPTTSCRRWPTSCTPVLFQIVYSVHFFFCT